MWSATRPSSTLTSKRLPQPSPAPRSSSAMKLSPIVRKNTTPGSSCHAKPRCTMRVPCGAMSVTLPVGSGRRIAPPNNEFRFRDANAAAVSANAGLNPSIWQEPCQHQPRRRRTHRRGPAVLPGALQATHSTNVESSCDEASPGLYDAAHGVNSYNSIIARLFCLAYSFDLFVQC